MTQIVLKAPPARRGREPMLTRADLRDLLGISTSTLIRWQRAGNGPAAYLVGGQWRYRREDVEEWLAGRRCPGGAA